MCLIMKKLLKLDKQNIKTVEHAVNHHDYHYHKMEAYSLKVATHIIVMTALINQVCEEPK